METPDSTGLSRKQTFSERMLVLLWMLHGPLWASIVLRIFSPDAGFLTGLEIEVYGFLPRKLRDQICFQTKSRLIPSTAGASQPTLRDCTIYIA
jgi:hypothetical protein